MAVQIADQGVNCQNCQGVGLALGSDFGLGGDCCEEGGGLIGEGLEILCVLEDEDVHEFGEGWVGERYLRGRGCF